MSIYSFLSALYTIILQDFMCIMKKFTIHFTYFFTLVLSTVFSELSLWVRTIWMRPGATACE